MLLKLRLLDDGDGTGGDTGIVRLLEIGGVKRELCMMYWLARFLDLHKYSNTQLHPPPLSFLMQHPYSILSQINMHSIRFQ